MVIFVYQFGMVAAFILGLIACFAGYRLFRFVLGLAGFVAGAAIAGGLYFTFVQASDVISIVVAIIGGILGAFLLSFFYFVGIFFAGAGLGALVGLVLAANLGWNRTVVVLIASILCGVLALAMQKMLIVVSTAFVGSWAVLAAVASYSGRMVPRELLSQPPVYWNSPWATVFLFAWILLGGIGIAAQYRSSARRAERSHSRDRTRHREAASS